MQGNIEVLHIAYVTERLVVFHNESNYDYYFIIEVFAEEFEGKFILI